MRNKLIFAWLGICLVLLSFLVTWRWMADVCILAGGLCWLAVVVLMLRGRETPRHGTRSGG